MSKLTLIALLLIIVGLGFVLFGYSLPMQQRNNSLFPPYSPLSQYNSPSQSPPPQPKVCGTYLVRDLLTRTEFIRNSTVGTITDIKQGDYNPAQGDEIVIAGEDGAITVAKNKRVLKTVKYGPYRYPVDIIDIEGDHIPEYMLRATWEDCEVLDSNGQLLWKTPQSNGNVPDDIAAGDVNGDGILEFAVGYNGNGGVSLLDKSGQVLWNNRQTGDVWHAEMADIYNDGKDEIIHSGDGDPFPTRRMRIRRTRPSSGSMHLMRRAIRTARASRLSAGRCWPSGTGRWIAR